jgi:hypothetical protein
LTSAGIPSLFQDIFTNFLDILVIGIQDHALEKERSKRRSTTLLFKEEIADQAVQIS